METTNTSTKTKITKADLINCGIAIILGALILIINNPY